MESSSIRVEVIYAEPQRIVAQVYQLPQESRVEDALRRAAGDPAFQGVAVSGAAVGIFGRAANVNERLVDGDRVEIYRPLAADPKVARRARARQSR